MLLVRPILTYACQVWYNIGPSTIEKLRKFERSCFRAHMNMYRTLESNYTRFYFNKKVYNSADITRIDNFILKRADILSHLQTWFHKKHSVRTPD